MCKRVRPRTHARSSLCVRVFECVRVCVCFAYNEFVFVPDYIRNARVMMLFCASACGSAPRDWPI